MATGCLSIPNCEIPALRSRRSLARWLARCARSRHRGYLGPLSGHRRSTMTGAVAAVTGDACTGGQGPAGYFPELRCWRACLADSERGLIPLQLVPLRSRYASVTGDTCPTAPPGQCLRRGCRVHFVPATWMGHPCRIRGAGAGRGAESPVTRMLCKRRSTKGHTRRPLCRPSPDMRTVPD